MISITIDGLHGHLPIEVAQQIHYHFPADIGHGQSLVLDLSTAVITGELEGIRPTLEQSHFLQEMANRYQQEIQMRTSHEGIVGSPDTYSFIPIKTS